MKTETKRGLYEKTEISVWKRRSGMSARPPLTNNEPSISFAYAYNLVLQLKINAVIIPDVRGVCVQYNLLEHAE